MTPPTREAMLRKICARGLLDFVDLDIAMEPLQLQYGMPTVFVEEHVYRPYVEKVRERGGRCPVLSVLGRDDAHGRCGGGDRCGRLRYGGLGARAHRGAAAS